MSNEILRKYIDIINEHETLNEEILEEGMLQRLAGLALGTVLALGPKIGQADTVFSYLDPNTNQMQTVLDMGKVPNNSKLVMAIDTDTNQVMVIKGANKGQQVTPDPSSVNQAQSAPAVEKSVENVGNKSLILTGYTLQEVKEKMIDKIMAAYPDAQIEDQGRTMTSTRYSIQGEGFGTALMTSLMTGSTGKMDGITRYNFFEKDGKIQITPQQFMRFTNAFGQPETTSVNPKNIVNVWYKEFNQK